MRLLAALLALLLGAVGARADIKWKVVKTLPHDTHAFTEGLFIADGLLYESTGQVGESDIRVMRLADAKLLKRQTIRADLFGEGIAPVGDKIVSLTWRTGEGFVWRRKDLKQIGTFSYTGEGWGLTSDGTSLIMSDGTPQLRFLDPQTRKEQHRITVTWGGQPVRYVNELEYVGGAIYANIWYSPLIARIDPRTGAISDWINLAPLVAENLGRDTDAVLNGIAWDEKAKLLYVTGKNWPKLYALRLGD
ncbi:glutaminyl-peptide cyclotransferase [Sphingobium nicotianae]|uniref:Glutaminyl-peptide cyclotransferase n=1 Tax=Sphingobium nicotianae TaxID=2782607 RepID=A0A9X1IST1_9SPHN|nr:glutaminyl-peptide cyclotransferase [Sphingobium nicotianae]MBT2188848.1 glutaminyl-peptide cyclotransferase [Sphingobium nicotianae]